MTEDAEAVRAVLPPALVAEYDADVRALELLDARELDECFPDSDYDGDRFVVPPTGVWTAAEKGVDPDRLYMPRWLRWCYAYVEKWWWLLVAACMVGIQFALVAIDAPLYITFLILAVTVLPNVAVLVFRQPRAVRMDATIKDLLDERLREHGDAWFSGQLELRDVLERRITSFTTSAVLLQELHGAKGSPVARSRP